MSGQKRHFPYYSAVPEMQLKQRAVSGVNPGKERADVRTFVPGNLEEAPASARGSEVCRRQSPNAYLTTGSTVGRLVAGPRNRLCCLDRTRDQGNA